jgi:hypothetical protein
MKKGVSSLCLGAVIAWTTGWQLGIARCAVATIHVALPGRPRTGSLRPHVKMEFDANRENRPAMRREPSNNEL